jgi:hypothetical protein
LRRTRAVRASFVDEEATLGPTAPALTGVAGIDAVVDGVRTCRQALFQRASDDHSAGHAARRRSGHSRDRAGPVAVDWSLSAQGTVIVL